MLCHQQEAVFKKADTNIPALVRRLPLEQRRDDRERAEEPSHDVIGGGADAQRPPARAGHVGQASHHLHDLIERGAMLIRACQKSFVGGNDELGIARAQLLEVRAHLGQRIVPEILDENVCSREQLVQRLPARFGPRIELH